MIVLATNVPQTLDEALQDRMDEIVHFERPSLKERIDILNYYLSMYCKSETKWYVNLKTIVLHPTILIYGKARMELNEISQDYIKSIAERTEGFSGRELNKLIVSMHDAAFAKEKPILDYATAEVVLARHLTQYKVKGKWSVSQSEYFKLMHPKV